MRLEDLRFLVVFVGVARVNGLRTRRAAQRARRPAPDAGGPDREEPAPAAKHERATGSPEPLARQPIRSTPPPVTEPSPRSGPG
ncbi:MAG: hypothetical protein RIS35_3363 [Pseudomonadota bacterium]|jgi:hypothetical protein